MTEEELIIEEETERISTKIVNIIKIVANILFAISGVSAAVFAILKSGEIINWEWLWVLSPLWLYGIMMAVFIVLTIFALYGIRAYNKITEWRIERLTKRRKTVNDRLEYLNTHRDEYRLAKSHRNEYIVEHPYKAENNDYNGN